MVAHFVLGPFQALFQLFAGCGLLYDGSLSPGSGVGIVSCGPRLLLPRGQFICWAVCFRCRGAGQGPLGVLRWGVLGGAWCWVL